MGQGGRPVQDGVVKRQRLAARHPEHMADAVLGQQSREESTAMTARLIHAHDRHLLSRVYEIGRCLPPLGPATGGVYQTTVFVIVCQAAGSPNMWSAYAPGAEERPAPGPGSADRSGCGPRRWQVELTAI